MRARHLLIGAGLAVVLGGVLWASLASPGKGKGPAVEVEKVGRRTVVARVKASGEINPRRKVEIQSKIIGEITSLPVREGDRVRAGQVVLEIEKQLYVAARDQAKAALDQASVNLERARAELANAELSFARVSKLRHEGVVSEDALDRARLERDSAEIGVRAQQEAIRQASSGFRRAIDDLERTTIRSPMDGVVTQLNVEQGETAVMGTMNFKGSVLMVIGDLSEMVAEVEVAESEVVALAPGQLASVRLDALADVELTGKVTEIGSSGIKEVDVVKFKVKVALDAPDGRVRPGMTAKVEITTKRAENVLAVPQQAVQTRWLDARGREIERKEGETTQHEVSAVYLFQAGKAARREVKSGIHDELWVEVREQLEEGAEIITGPYRVLRSLKDGDPLRREEKRAASQAKGGGDKEKGSAD
ncbi:MAG: efflux RND transporter periplasmic adaptor subunit [Acidobacteriota bacterium]